MHTSWELREQPIDGREWQKLLSTHDHLLFHTSEWARVLRAGLCANPISLTILKEGVVVGGMAGMQMRSLWTQHLYFNFPYGGVIGQSPSAAILADLLENYARTRRAARVRLVCPPGFSLEGKDGFSVTPLSTRVIDIRNQHREDIWARLKGSVRRNIRKARKSGLDVVQSTSKADIDVFYELYLESMRRNHALPKYGPAIFEAIHDELCATDQASLLLARHEGHYVAGLLLVDSHRTSHYIMGGSRLDSLPMRPNDLLFYAAISRACELEKDSFDFLPSGPADQALDRFKAKWGARPYATDTLDLICRPISLRSWELAVKAASWSPARAMAANLRDLAEKRRSRKKLP